MDFLRDPGNFWVWWITGVVFITMALICIRRRKGNINTLCLLLLGAGFMFHLASSSFLAVTVKYAWFGSVVTLILGAGPCGLWLWQAGSNYIKGGRLDTEDNRQNYMAYRDSIDFSCRITPVFFVCAITLNIIVGFVSFLIWRFI